MPNKTGGKNYKKSKHAGSSVKAPFIDRQPDQIYARVIKNVGSRNMLCYCNDNKVRFCHIRGSMRKRVWLNVGDIVLISLREFEKTADESPKKYEHGDIIAKYHEDHMSRLKKMPDVNKKLFQQLENADNSQAKGEAELSLYPPSDEEAFDFDADDKRETAEGEGESGDSEGSEDSDKEIDIDDI